MNLGWGREDKQESMKTIGVYVPGWLYHSDKTDRIFTDELINTIKASGRYRVTRLNMATLTLSNSMEAEEFVKNMIWRSLYNTTLHSIQIGGGT